MGVIDTSLNYVLNRLYDFISYVNLGDTINYYMKDYDNNCISTTYDKRHLLYGLNLKVSSNIEKSFEMPSIDSGGKLLISIVKNGNVCDIFVFSEDKLLMETISGKLGVELLNPDELISALYSVFLIDTYYIEDKQIKNRYIQEKQEFLGNDPLHIIFPQMIKNSTVNLLKNYKPFQAVAFQKSDKYSSFDLLSIEWQGVIFFLVDFSEKEISNYINACKNSAKLMDSNFTKKFNELNKQENIDALREILRETAVINSIAFVKSQKDIYDIEKKLLIKYEPRYLSMDKIASKTLLRARDRDFDFLVPRSWATKLISTALQKDALSFIKNKSDIHHRVDFAGLDMQNNFINYTFKQSINPHSLILGTTGIGKSVLALNIMSQIVDFDFEKKIARSLNETRKIRYLNVGFSGGRIFEAIQLQGIAEDREIMQRTPSEIGKLRFSLFDFEGDYPNEQEFKSLVAFLNLMFSFERNQPFSEQEAKIFKECIFRTCKEKGNMPTSITIKELKANYGADYKVFIDQILREKDDNGKLLYNELTTLGELSDKYKRFKRPILRDVIAQLDVIKNDISRTESERKTIENVKDKLSLLVSNNIYSLYSNIDLRENIPMFYAEFDRIKEHTRDFVAIGWLLITCWFRVDKERALECMNSGKPKPDSYYFIDEAHNFLNHEVFKDLIGIYAREMRKYGCQLCLITQHAQDIDKKTISFFATKFFVFTENDKEHALHGLKYANGGKELSESEYRIFNKIENTVSSNRVYYMQHTGGASAFSFIRQPKYSHFFDSFDF